MKLTLQQHYDLIKQGKGTRDIFLKEAKSLFPQYIPLNASVDIAISSLKYKGIISESAPTKTEQTDWFKLFETKMAEAKAEEKNPTKEVVDMEIRGFDFKDKDNIDNIYGQAFLTGLYAEIKDEKNKGKSLDDLKKIVAKNLKKDFSYYIIDGQFGIKGLGYEQYPSDKSLKEHKGCSCSQPKTEENKKLIKEYTDNSFSGQELISRVGTPDLIGLEAFTEFFPNGVASETEAHNALKLHDQSQIKQRMGRYAPMFVHVQYHRFTDPAGEKYLIHQTQYYNSNFKDTDPNFNPSVTKLFLKKLSDKDNPSPQSQEDIELGSILVKTDEYIKDLQDLRNQGLLGDRVSESKLNENKHYEDKLLNIIFKYIKDTDEAEQELDNYLDRGWNGFTDVLKANLERDMDFITLTQQEHDENIQNWEQGLNESSINLSSYIKDESLKESNTNITKEKFLKLHDDVKNWERNKSSFMAMYKMLTNADIDSRDMGIAWDEADDETRKKMINYVNPNRTLPEGKYRVKSLPNGKYFAIDANWNDEYQGKNGLFITIKGNRIYDKNGEMQTSPAEFLTQFGEDEIIAVKESQKPTDMENEKDGLGENMDKPFFRTPVQTVDPNVSSIMNQAYEEYIQLYPTQDIDFVDWLKNSPEGQIYFNQAQDLLTENPAMWAMSNRPKVKKDKDLKETPTPYKVGDVLFDEEKNQTVKITRIEGDRIYVRRYEDAVIIGQMPEYWVKSSDLTVDESLNEYASWELNGTFSDIEDAKKEAKLRSQIEGVVQHVNELPDGTYKIEDWYDSDTTVASYEFGNQLNESNEPHESGLIVYPSNINDVADLEEAFNDEELYFEFNEIEGYFFFPEDEETYDALEKIIENILVSSNINARIEGVFKENKLNENLQKRLKEIDHQSEVSAVESKLTQIEEEIKKRQSKLNMVSENEDLAELVDKKATSKLTKEIKILEKKQKFYIKQHEKLTKKSKKELLDETNDAPTEEQLSKMKDELESYVDTVGNYEEAVDLYLDKHPNDEKYRTILLGIAEPLF